MTSRYCGPRAAERLCRAEDPSPARRSRCLRYARLEIDDDRLPTRVAQDGKRFRRRSPVGYDSMDARKGTNDKAAALGELGSVRQNDQLVGAPQKFRFRACDQGVALDHAERAD